MRNLKVIAVIISAVALIAGCSWNNMARGGAIGAGVGGVVGGIIGHQMGNTAVGAIVGAAVGGTAGAAIGHYMDKQAEEMRRDLQDAKIERVGEGIKITFNSGILFDVGSDKLKSQAVSNVDQLSKILLKYKDTNILVEGHTDSTGNERMNMNLSDDRSNSVARELKNQGVTGARISTNGYGETQPVADNGTSYGR